MDLEQFGWTCKTHRPIAIVLQLSDYDQLKRALDATPVLGDWDRENMRYLGAPVLRSQFSHSYIIEDTPQGPLIYSVG